MAEQKQTLELSNGSQIDLTIRRDKRLKKTARWQREPDGSLLVRIPYRYPKRNLPDLLKTIRKQVENQKQRARRRTDADLQARAEYINARYFNGKIRWEAIRWVPPMKTRLGSCTTGGPTDGHIRISEEIKAWPQWVVDYIIAHEMAHRLHPNHSKSFWQTLEKAYPKTEQARGFVKGVMFAQGRQWDDN
ncbi:MAG TPA: M48 family metallopeptidase [Anaerolineales bacterium]|nr:M48 family metallopeptidase [Anaerolineales bacterium]